MHLPHRLLPRRRPEGADVARLNAAGETHFLRKRCLPICRALPVPLHLPTSGCNAPQKAMLKLKAEDALARRYDAPCDVAAGVHGAVGGARAIPVFGHSPAGFTPLSDGSVVSNRVTCSSAQGRRRLLTIFTDTGQPALIFVRPRTSYQSGSSGIRRSNSHPS